jgi:hypothetical protein
VLLPRRARARVCVCVQYSGWYCNNDANMYLGTNPSCWGDGGCTLANMANDKETWRTVINKRGYGGRNAVVWAEEWYYYSSTNSRHVVAWFRIQNTTPNAINWSPFYYYTCFGSWGNHASVNINGNQVWSSSSSCQMCTVRRSVVVQCFPWGLLC